MNPLWHPFRVAGWLVILAGLVVLPGRCPAAERPAWVHSGMANASLAVRVGTNRFLTGCDEDNVVKLYKAGASGSPLAEFNLSRWLELHGHPADADIEGAARVDDTVYWIGSHSRSKDGRSRPNHERLLATRIHEGTNGVTLERIGHPCQTLLGALLKDPQLARFHLAEAATKAPEEEGGLNIEGIAAAPDGSLLIGFRSPLVDEKALLVPLLNPAECVQGVAPRLGEPVLLDLGGLGIRDITFTGLEYFVIGGRTGHGGTSHLFRWAGGSAVPEKLERSGLRKLNSEGIANFGTRERPHLLIVSDDGNHPGNQWRPPSLRTFRSLWVEP